MLEVYPPRRWAEADRAVDRRGLLESVHGIGSAAFARYMGLVAAAEPEPARSDSAVCVAPLPLSDRSIPYDNGADGQGLCVGDEGATAAEVGGAADATTPDNWTSADLSTESSFFSSAGEALAFLDGQATFSPIARFPPMGTVRRSSSAAASPATRCCPEPLSHSAQAHCVQYYPYLYSMWSVL